jgi:hypothetical protein
MRLKKKGSLAFAIMMLLVASFPGSMAQSLALRPQIQGILNSGSVINYGPGSPWEVKWGYYGDIRMGLEYTSSRLRKFEFSVASFSPTFKISTPGVVSTKGVNVLAFGAEYSFPIFKTKIRSIWYAKAGMKFLFNHAAEWGGSSSGNGGTIDRDGFLIDSTTGYADHHTFAFPIGLQWLWKNKKQKEVMQFELVLNLPTPIGNAAIVSDNIHYSSIQQPGTSYLARGITYPTSFQLGISKSITLWRKKR